MKRSPIIAVFCLVIGFVELTRGKTFIEGDDIHRYILEGDELSLRCVQEEGRAVVWKKDDGDVPQSMKREDRAVNTQTISVLTTGTAGKSDGGEYRCERQGDSSDGSYVIVNILTITVTIYPDFVEKQKDTSSATCDVSAPKEKIQWFHAGEEIEEGENYDIHGENNTLTIRNMDADRIGEYECRVTLKNGKVFSRSGSLNSKPRVTKFDKSKNLVHGDPLTLHCEAWGYPAINISWYRDGVLLAATDRISFSDKDSLVNATLKIDSVEFSDRAEYTCEAVNQFGSGNSTILVRVKDKLAALWPFLGICAEVIILCTIIFVYEKMRAKKMALEDEQEEAQHMTSTNSNDHKGGDEIRQRK